MQGKVLIKSYGCQMNVYDAQRMEEDLSSGSYSVTSSLDDADVVILNTCHIREGASEKVYSHLGVLHKLKRERRERGERGLFVGVVGCVAQAHGEQVFERAPFVDFVLGPQAYHHLPDILEKLRAAPGSKHLCLDFKAEEKFESLATRGSLRRAPTAFLTIQEGCDKFCTFCVVPYTRGAEVSRPVADVEKEARALVALGVREVTLLGQNVSAYHGRNEDGHATSLADLIRHLAQIDGLDRIFYTTGHPIDVTLDLVRAHRDVSKLMPYIHLPIQSGSDAVLKRMNRHHRVEDYLYVVDLLRKARPDIALSSDLIVAFPGETNEEFEETIQLAESIRFARAYSFKYSPRPGTPSAAMIDREGSLAVPSDVASARLISLQEVLHRHQTAFNEALVGRVVPALCERVDEKSGNVVGKTPYAQPVYVGPSDGGDGDCIGRIRDVCIGWAGLNRLRGVFV